MVKEKKTGGICKMQDIEKERIEVYEIDNKKYTVISKCVENPNNIDRLYDVLCKFAISKLNASVEK